MIYKYISQSYYLNIEAHKPKLFWLYNQFFFSPLVKLWRGVHWGLKSGAFYVQRTILDRVQTPLVTADQ